MRNCKVGFFSFLRCFEGGHLKRRARCNLTAQERQLVATEPHRQKEKLVMETEFGPTAARNNVSTVLFIVFLKVGVSSKSLIVILLF